jgi:hypothetical protein
MFPLALANMFVSNLLARKRFVIVLPALLLAAAHDLTLAQVCTPPVSRKGQGGAAKLGRVHFTPAAGQHRAGAIWTRLARRACKRTARADSIAAG